MLALALICVQHRVEVENALAAIAPWVHIVTRLGISILTVQCTEYSLQPNWRCGESRKNRLEKKLTPAVELILQPSCSVSAV